MEIPRSLKTGVALALTSATVAAAGPALAQDSLPAQHPQTPENAQPVEQDPNYKVCKQLGAVGAGSWLIPYRNPQKITTTLDVKGVDNELCDHIANREKIQWDIVTRSPRTKRLARISRGVLKFFGEDEAQIRKTFRVKKCAPSQQTRRVSLRQRVTTRMHDGNKKVTTRVAPTVKQYC